MNLALDFTGNSPSIYFFCYANFASQIKWAREDFKLINIWSRGGQGRYMDLPSRDFSKVNRGVHFLFI